MARLLLVDDDIAEISAVKRVLARASLAPVLATNASDAQAALAQRPVDLLLVGATCEGGEALAMARRLEQDEATRGLPLIVLGTATDAPAHAVQLPRPIDPAALAEQVQLALASRRTAPAAAAPARPAGRPIGRMAAPAPPPPAAPAPAPAPAVGPGARPAFERRGPPIVLPDPLERRARPSDPANARRAAAEALRARADELRRAPPAAPAPAAAEAAAGLDALFELAPPAGVTPPAAPTPEPTAPELTAPEPPAPAPPAPAAAPADGAPLEVELDVEGGPATAAPDPAAAWFEAADAPIAETPFDLPGEPELTAAMFEEPPPAGEPPPDLAGEAPPPEPPRRIVDEIEERARAEEALAAEAEARRARQAEQAAQVEAQARVEAARLAEAEASRAREAEERARGEAEARAEAARQAEEAAARARQAEAAAREEAEARRLLEAELARLRAQLDERQEAHQAELRSVAARAVAEEQAVAELRLHEANQAREAAVAEAASEAARRAEAEAQARSSEALEALRAQAEGEAARRAEAEAALARLSEEAARLAAERAALAEAAAAASVAASLAPPAGVPAGEPAPPPAPGPSLADVPPPDAAQEAARRRALSLRQRREGAEVPPPPAWHQPYQAPAPPSAEPPEPLPLEPEPATPGLPPAELSSGDLEELPAPRLLALAARARLGGRIDVTGEAARSLWFEDGQVAGAASNVPGERVEEVALRLGLLTREQHRQVAGAAAALASRRAALLLVERGYLKPAELTALVRRRTEEVAFGVFGEPRARFRWVPDPVPADERVAPDRPALALAVEGVRRRWLAPRADAVLGGPASILGPAAGAPGPAELGLAAEERRLLALADGLRTLDEVLALSPLDGLSSRQLLAAAVLTGALTVRVVHAGRPAAQVAAAIDLARVKEKLEQVRRADYFTILGIGRVCTPHEVRQAADRLLADLAPERFQGAREEGLPARLEEIRRVVGEAREVLADDALRAEYLRGLPG